MWLGQPDPAMTRLLLQKNAEPPSENMATLLVLWERMDPERKGLTASEVIEQLYKKPPEDPPDYHADMRAVLDGLLVKTDARCLGNQLRLLCRRNLQGRFIDRVGREHQAVRWAFFLRRRWGMAGITLPRLPRKESKRESGESGESFSASDEIAIRAK